MFYVAVNVLDMPVNISRERSTNDKIIKLVIKQVKNKIFSILKDLKKNPEKFKEMLKNHSQLLKMGITEEALKQKELLELVPFDNAKTPEEPIVKDLVKDGYNVLLLSQPIDECAILKINNFEGKTLQDINKANFEHPKQDKNKDLTAESPYKEAAAIIKETLKNNNCSCITDVKFVGNFEGNVKISVAQHGMSA